MATATETPKTLESAAWINSLSSVMKLSDTHLQPSLLTIVSSDVKNGKLALFVPSEMSELQPQNLTYLHAMASHNACILIEDRRNSDIRPLVEQRELKPHKLSIGIAELLTQTGMPGQTPTLSTPHRLAPGNKHITVKKLIDMVSATVNSSKRVVVQPTPAIVENTGNEIHPINAHACKLRLKEEELVVTYFDSPSFKAIGYIAETQFVVHVFAGGGPAHSPNIWANEDTLLKNRFRFQLFRSNKPGEDFGLLYNTFYFDIDAQAGEESREEDQNQVV